MSDFQAFGSFTYQRPDGGEEELYVWIEVDVDDGSINFIHVARDPVIDTGWTARPKECTQGRLKAALDFIKSMPVALPHADEWPEESIDLIEGERFGKHQGGSYS